MPSSDWIARVRDNVIVRLTAYYAVGLFGSLLLFSAFPNVSRMLERERFRELPGAFTEEPSREITESVPLSFQWETVISVGIGMLGAFLLALPVAWVYLWTREPKAYRRSVAQTLVVLPIAIALAVFLVKGSLALAFSLAGIVAAIRWRTTLNETMDAVFMFVVIAIGLSAGVLLLFVTLLGSVAFNATVLTVWHFQFGEHPARLVGWRLYPAAQTAASGEAARTPFQATLRIPAKNIEASQRDAELVLNAYAKRWHLARITHDPDGTPILEYLVRLKRRSNPAAVLAVLERYSTTLDATFEA